MRQSCWQFSHWLCWFLRIDIPYRPETITNEFSFLFYHDFWVFLSLIHRTSSNSKHLPHSCKVTRWLLSGSQDSRNGAMQCSRAINGARIGNSSWMETDRSCGCPSKSHHFQIAALAQRRVWFVSASDCKVLYWVGNSSVCAKSFITLNSQSRIRLGKSLISSSVQFYGNIIKRVLASRYKMSGSSLKFGILFTGISLHSP